MNNSEVQAYIKKVALKHMDNMINEIEGDCGRLLLSNVDVKSYNAAITRIILVMTKSIQRIV